MIENTKEEETLNREEKDVELIDNIIIQNEDYTHKFILKLTAFAKLFNLRLMKLNVPDTLVLSEDMNGDLIKELV